MGPAAERSFEDLRAVPAVLKGVATGALRGGLLFLSCSCNGREGGRNLCTMLLLLLLVGGAGGGFPAAPGLTAATTRLLFVVGIVIVVVGGGGGVIFRVGSAAGGAWEEGILS